MSISDQFVDYLENHKFNIFDSVETTFEGIIYIWETDFSFTKVFIHNNESIIELSVDMFSGRHDGGLYKNINDDLFFCYLSHYTDSNVCKCNFCV